MGNSHIIYDKKIEVLKGILEAHISVLSIPRNKKFLDGIKVKCVLLDLENNIPILLLDNHEPYGYHLHSKLPEDKNYREMLDFENYEEAILFFMKELTRRFNYEY